MTENTSTGVEAIRRRAHEISLGPDAGTPEENWLRAEEELRRPPADEDPVRRGEEEALREAETGELLQAHLSSYMHP
jgi:hypothetical protein